MGHWVWAIPACVIAVDLLVLTWFLLTWSYREQMKASAADTRRIEKHGRGHAA